MTIASGCSREDADSPPLLFNPAQLNSPSYSIGVPQGTTAMSAVEKQYPNSEIKYFGSLNEGYMAVKYGKIDAFAFDRHTLKYITLKNPDLTLMTEKIADDHIVIGGALGHEALIHQVNAFIREYRANGTYEEMYNRWILQPNPQMPVIPKAANPTSKIKIGTEGLNEPMNYYAEGELTGFDVEFSQRLALFLNAELVLQGMDFVALMSSASIGKVDLMVANLNATPESALQVIFSDPYVDTDIAFMVRKDRLAASAPAVDAAEVEDEPNALSDAIASLAGQKVGVLTGSIFDQLTSDNIPGAIPDYFNSFSDLIAALQSGKIKAFLVDEPIARNMVNNTAGVHFIKEMLVPDSYAFIFPKTQDALRVQVNAALQQMHADGTIKAIDAIWFGTDEAAKVLPNLPTKPTTGVIRVTVSSTSPPFNYFKGDRVVGYEVDIIHRIANQLGLSVEITDVDFASIFPALAAGMSDMGMGCISITPERAKSVLFSDPNYSGGVVLMLTDTDSMLSAAKNTTSQFVTELAESFNRTFVVEGRYKLVLKGLWATILISVMSCIIGTILGFGICMMRRSQARWASVPALIFVRAIQGTPILVILMILYYIVFGRFDINGIVVAIIAFSINFAAYVAEMMRSGIDSINKGQHEAAFALGFNRFQVFTKITFPQAAQLILPVFRGEFVSMLKMTSVVGYIAIQDLTKMSDIIRSRTYEAFFPLIATAIIYFLIAWLFTYFLEFIEKSIDPKRRKRVVKGVVYS